MGIRNNMESEKVKEIKNKLKAEISIAENYEFEYRSLKLNCLQDILTLINELESENERLNKSDTSKEESSIEYYILYKDLKRKNKDLNELCELQRVSIAESFVRENQLKDRIAELEKEKKEYGKKKFLRGWKLGTEELAERLKEKGKSTYDFFQCPTKENRVISIYDINETLKEFIDVDK